MNVLIGVLKMIVLRYWWKVVSVEVNWILFCVVGVWVILLVWIVSVCGYLLLRSLMMCKSCVCVFMVCWIVEFCMVVNCLRVWGC